MEHGFLIGKIKDISINDGLVENPNELLNMNSSYTKIQSYCQKVSPNITFDFGKKVTGYIYLEVISSSSDSILVEYGPVSNLMHCKKIIKMPSNNLLWVDDHYIACRYMRISLVSDSGQNTGCEVLIKRIGLISSEYPCVWKGDFKTNDEQLNKIWQMGAYTLQLCMQRSNESSNQKLKYIPQFLTDFINTWKGTYSQYIIFDAPRRDREAWIGDIRTEALMAYTAFGADDVVKSSLEIFLDLQRNDGVTFACAGTRQLIIEYNFWWIISIWECYLYTGDKDFLKRFYPGVTRLMNYIKSNMDERGFIYNDGNWMWTLPREGYSSGAECILYYALVCSSKIEEALDNKLNQKAHLELAEKVKENIIKEFWDEKRGVFIDDLKLLETQIPILTDVNCYAIVFGIVDGQKAKRILDYLKENMWCPYGTTTLDKRIEKAKIMPNLINYPLGDFIGSYSDPDSAAVRLMYPHNKQVWPFINGYEVEARLISGDFDNAFELIKRCWGNPAYEETGTFWELFDIDHNGDFSPRSLFEIQKDDCMNSAAHGWSGWISYILQAYILGVKPVEAGFKKVVISPIIHKLKNISGKVPTPFGLIIVKINVENNSVNIDVKHPKEIEIEVKLPQIYNEMNSSINIEVGGE